MKPREYQLQSIKSLCAILPRFGVAMDASDTGVGKTYVAAFTAKELGWKVAVICPKSVIPSWKAALESIGVPYLFISNIEALRFKGTYFKKDKDSIFEYRWHLPERVLLIFDEAHRFSGSDTGNAKILASAPKPVLMLSATCADSPVHLRAIGHQLGIVHWDKWYAWCFQNGCVKNLPFNGLKFVGGQEVIERLHKQVFGEKGIRLRISDLGDAFPSNSIEAVPITVDDADAINAEYVEALQQLEAEAPTYAVQLLRARQISEHLKVQSIVEMTEDLLKEGKSVAIFVCFRDTLDLISKNFPNGSLIFGEQDPLDRQEAIERFQSNVSSVIVSTIQAGGVGVSLHDLEGDHPRVSLICPSFSAVDVKQALGRIHRNGAKTPCIQRILFAAETVEEQVRRKVEQKIDRIDLLNDGDLV